MNQIYTGRIAGQKNVCEIHVMEHVTRKKRTKEEQP